MDDPRHYFTTEARELVEGLTQGALHLERTGALTEPQRKHLMRLAHTLKGAARIVKETGIADAAHAIEDLITAAGDTPPRQLASRLLAHLDAISRQIPEEPALQPADRRVSTAPREEAARTVRVELSEVDGLLQRAVDVAARCAEIREQLSAAAAELPPSARRAVAALDSLAGEVAHIRDDARRMRLMPANTLFVTLERAVRDAAQAAGIRARFVASGGEHRLDADVLATIRDALIQIVRNA